MECTLSSSLDMSDGDGSPSNTFSSPPPPPPPSSSSSWAAMSLLVAVVIWHPTLGTTTLTGTTPRVVLPFAAAALPPARFFLPFTTAFFIVRDSMSTPAAVKMTSAALPATPEASCSMCSLSARWIASMSCPPLCCSRIVEAPSATLSIARENLLVRVS